MYHGSNKTFYNNYFLNECLIPENFLMKIFNEDFKKNIHSPCEDLYKHFCEIKSGDNEQKLADVSRKNNEDSEIFPLPKLRWITSKSIRKMK